MPYCVKCGKEYGAGDAFCSGCGQPLNVAEQIPAGQPGYGAPAVELSMSWFKFLINFALFAAAVLNLYSAVLYLTGFVYEQAGSSAWRVYAYFDGLQVVDIIYGVLLVAVAVFCVITRFKLAKFKAVAPKLLTILYLANIALVVVYTVAASIIFETFGASDLVVGVTGPLILLFVNRAYFKKRAHLFVN